MRLSHIALVCSSELNADFFYKRILELNKKSVKILPAELSKLIFDIPVEIKIVLYGNDSVDFEILLIPGHQHIKPRSEHVCIKTENTDSLLEKCTNAGLKILRVPKGPSVLCFIEDFDGNVFEIKEI